MLAALLLGFDGAIFSFDHPLRQRSRLDYVRIRLHNAVRMVASESVPWWFLSISMGRWWHTLDETFRLLVN